MEGSVAEMQWISYVEYWYGVQGVSAEILLETIAKVMHCQVCLSEEWKVNTLLLTEDIQYVLCAAQAWLAKQQKLRALTLPVWTMDLFMSEFELLVKFNEGLFSTLCQESRLPVMVPVHFNNHFRTFVLLPTEKTVLMYDYLMLPCAHLRAIQTLCERNGFRYKSVIDQRVQLDSWSCGLWVIWTFLCFNEGLNTRGITDVKLLEGWFRARLCDWSRSGVGTQCMDSSFSQDSRRVL